MAPQDDEKLHMLAAATPNARTVVLPGAGHMMMCEAPDELLAALQS